MIEKILLLSLLGYLCGSVLNAVWVCRAFGHADVYESGHDHNPGVFNVFSLCGVGPGMLCLALELLKGALPVTLALRILPAESCGWALVLAAPVLGHAFPIGRLHRGGKAIAVSFGVLIGLLPVSPVLLVLAGLYVFFSVAVVLHPNEKRSVITYVLLFIACPLLRRVWPMSMGMCAGCMLMSVVVALRNLPDAGLELPGLNRTSR